MGQQTAGGGRGETAAEVFDRLFLPAMAGPWAVRVADTARLAPGERVLDVACGTGAVAQEALRRVGPEGEVAGVDLSTDMLAVARRKLPDLDLREGDAESLPFEDDTFDAVTCQFALMFFHDAHAALQEMLRVLRPGGRVSVAVWDSLDRTPGYAALTGMVERHLGPAAGAAIRAAFALGDVDVVRSMLQAAGFVFEQARSVDATTTFPSLQDCVEAEVRGWVGGEIGDREYAALLAEAEDVLSPYVRADGTVEFTLPAILATGQKKMNS
jgi:ubiquinone/menaquinone biosynthesis C-methylase UbiE